MNAHPPLAEGTNAHTLPDKLKTPAATRPVDASTPPQLRYALVTPARNEEQYIESTIRSVLAQTHRPQRWVIVSDGSTDGTDAIVQRYQDAYPWIQLVRTPPRTERHFAGKVMAFNAGYARLTDLDVDIIGSLDADISFEADYFDFLISRFANNPQLGVAGTPFEELNRSYDYRFTSIEHVSGACQMFRRACFESIGGYRPVKGGGIDWIAVTSARMRGWQTRSFTERHSHHARPMGTAQAGSLRAKFELGSKDYRLGGHPLWQLFRGTYQMRSHPVLLGGLALMVGFFWDMLRRQPKAVDAELQAFHRGEQMRRLKAFLTRSKVGEASQGERRP
jgi:poly-beta-1,6-N-acetyl-D-glucosamine synthase